MASREGLPPAQVGKVPIGVETDQTGESPATGYGLIASSELAGGGGGAAFALGPETVRDAAFKTAAMAGEELHPADPTKAVVVMLSVAAGPGDGVTITLGSWSGDLSVKQTITTEGGYAYISAVFGVGDTYYIDTQGANIQQVVERSLS